MVRWCPLKVDDASKYVIRAYVIRAALRMDQIVHLRCALEATSSDENQENEGAEKAV